MFKLLQGGIGMSDVLVTSRLIQKTSQIGRHCIELEKDKKFWPTNNIKDALSPFLSIKSGLHVAIICSENEYKNIDNYSSLIDGIQQKVNYQEIPFETTDCSFDPYTNGWYKCFYVAKTNVDIAKGMLCVLKKFGFFSKENESSDMRGVLEGMINVFVGRENFSGFFSSKNITWIEELSAIFDSSQDCYAKGCADIKLLVFLPFKSGYSFFTDEATHSLIFPDYLECVIQVRIDEGYINYERLYKDIKEGSLHIKTKDDTYEPVSFERYIQPDYMAYEKITESFENEITETQITRNEIE